VGARLGAGRSVGGALSSAPQPCLASGSA
jgi:hypothetical protein